MVAYCSTPAVLRLAVGSTVLDLMDQANGFRVAEVDIGLPEIRDDVDPAADRHGTVDYTRLYGARAVTISGSIVPSAQGSRQQALRALSPFLDPAARPTLTYQIDGDATPRTLTLRVSDLSSPFNSPQVSAFSVGWKCPDPVAYDANVQTAIAWVTVAGGGRQYNLVFNRVYPPGGSGTAYATNNGTVAAYPLLRLYGPITGAQITERLSGAGTYLITFQPTFVISAGNFVAIDTRQRTAFLNGNNANNVYGQLQVSGGAWPRMPPGVQTSWTLTGTNTSNATQVQIQWQDAYLL